MYQALDVLNKLNEADTTAMRILMRFQIACNADLSKLPNVQVRPHVYYERYKVGPLGVLNALFGDDETRTYIAYDFEASKFVSYTPGVDRKAS